MPQHRSEVSTKSVVATTLALRRAPRCAVCFSATLLLASALLVSCSSFPAGRSLPTEPFSAATSSSSAPTFTPVPTPTPIPTPTPAPTVPIAALVDGQPIALADLDSQVAQYRQALLDQGLDLATSDGQAQLAAARQDVLEAMIDQVLIEQRAVTMGITVSSSDIEADLSQAISAGGGQAAFDGWLSSTAQTRQEFGLLLGRSLLQQRVFEAVTSDISDHAEQVHLRQIEVATEQAALEIVALIRAGSDFASLAQERSTNAATAGAGGDLGWFPHGLLAPELEAPAFFLRPGDVGEPVRVGDSYCVIQVVERDPARPLAPEHHLALKQAAFDRWLDAQRSKAVIQRLVGQ